MNRNYPSSFYGKIAIFPIFTFLTLAFSAQNTFLDGNGNSTFDVGVGTQSPENILHIHDNSKDKLTVKSGLVDESVKSQILITNDFTGQSYTDGMVLGTKNKSGFLTNQEEGPLTLRSGNAALMLNGQNSRLSVGLFVSNTNNRWGAFNVKTKDNGLAIKVLRKDKFGLNIQVKEADDQAIRVVDNQGNSDFSVLGNGHVFARRYVTTLNNIPDYVFDKDYNLMDLQTLENFIKKNGHLPNIPSAENYSKSGVDIGELNRLLLEKVEELTLYILELNRKLEQNYHQ